MGDVWGSHPLPPTLGGMIMGMEGLGGGEFGVPMGQGWDGGGNRVEIWRGWGIGMGMG